MLAVSLSEWKAGNESPKNKRARPYKHSSLQHCYKKSPPASSQLLDSISKLVVERLPHHRFSLLHFPMAYPSLLRRESCCGPCQRRRIPSDCSWRERAAEPLADRSRRCIRIGAGRRRMTRMFEELRHRTGQWQLLWWVWTRKSLGRWKVGGSLQRLLAGTILCNKNR